MLSSLNFLLEWFLSSSLLKRWLFMALLLASSCLPVPASPGQNKKGDCYLLLFFYSLTVSLRRKIYVCLQISEGWSALAAFSKYLLAEVSALPSVRLGGFFVLFAGVGLSYNRKIKACQAVLVGLCRSLYFKEQKKKKKTAVETSNLDWCTCDRIIYWTCNFTISNFGCLHAWAQIFFPAIF